MDKNSNAMAIQSNQTINSTDLPIDILENILFENEDLKRLIAHLNFSIKNNQSQSDDSLMVLEFWPWQVVLISLYSITAIASLLMNAITIYVLLSKKERLIPSILWKFLINLSIADMCMSIFCIPFSYTGVMLQRWIFFDFLCPIVNFAQVCSVFVSVWTLTIIGIDR